jgi:predicted nuclease of predicted toxin-antitoxin system
MRFKLDENLGTHTLHIFQAAGHDVQTVRMQGLQGTNDTYLFEICCHEQRCLVTLDLDFTNVLRFPPAHSQGIVVLRMPRNPSLAVLEQMVRRFLHILARMPIEQQLWIVEPTSIRIHESLS